MVIRQEFINELNHINASLKEMGRAIEQSIDDMLQALMNQDVELAKKVIENDDKVDALEAKLESECIGIIALQQPIASDLRMVASALKMITDLERIADHCADISEYTIKLSGTPYKKPLEDIPKMAIQTKKMVNEIVDSYIELDIVKAKKVMEQDDIVDAYFSEIVKELNTMMKEDSNFVEQGTYLLFIAKYLERMADHATNIGGWIIYNVTGKH